MNVKLELKETSQPIEREDVLNCYPKGDFFIPYRSNQTVEWYPVANIWRVTKDY